MRNFKIHKILQLQNIVVRRERNAFGDPTTEFPIMFAKAVDQRNPFEPSALKRQTPNAPERRTVNVER
jgi:hypothetical protein